MGSTHAVQAQEEVAQAWETGTWVVYMHGELGEGWGQRRGVRTVYMLSFDGFTR